jgi:FtsP/CotA-like multicopper oxidase with cupredoxin domain
MPPVPGEGTPRRWVTALAVAAVLVAGGTLWTLVANRASSSPSTSPSTAPAQNHHQHGPAATDATSVLDFTGPRAEAPDVRYELVARTSTITTDTGQEIQALTYNGTSPGPTVRARAGQLVEVVLRNVDVTSGVTIHWHGLDVPNAEDGVAGVTQNAVLPGGEHTYRFRSDQVGTFWYHSHQDAANAVSRGLYGALIIDPPMPSGPSSDQPLDLPLVAHTWTAPNRMPADELAQAITVGMSATTVQQPVPPGRSVHLRLINTDGLPQTWSIAGAPFRVVAIDGTPVNAPGELAETSLRVAGGGRYDVELLMPDSSVAVRLLELNQPGVLLVPGRVHAAPGPADSDALPALAEEPRFDPLSYGAPSSSPPLQMDTFDHEAELILETKQGRRSGLPYLLWTINGRVFPDVPTITVAEGDLVRVRIVNKSTDVHPMHLHGHHVLVLSRNGVPATGSPWWTDTLGVEPGDDYVIAFRADNPGIWMDHCHNLTHAAAGMIMHLSYRGVTTPFDMHHGNSPE